MRLGITLWADRDVAGLARLAACAERTGFDDVWWPDHYMHRDVGATLTACALATDRVRLGTAVTSPLLRHPGALASLFASLAEIAPGRIVAGIGPGGWELPTQLGIHEPRPLTVTRETAVLLADLLRGRPATAPARAASSRDDSGCLPPKTDPRFRGPGRREISGRFRVSTTQNRPEISEAPAPAAADHTRFPLTGARLDFTPPQPIPLYLAARGPRMMSLAGELADGLITHSLSLPFIEHVVERVELGAQRAAAADTQPRQATDCSIAVWLEIFLHDDLAHAREVLRPRCRYMVGGEFDPSMIPLYGLDPAAVMPVRQAVRANDPNAHELITDDMVDAFSICGSVDRAGDRIDALRSAGVSEVILSFGPGITDDEIASVGETMLAFLDR